MKLLFTTSCLLTALRGTAAVAAAHESGNDIQNNARSDRLSRHLQLEIPEYQGDTVEELCASVETSYKALVALNFQLACVCSGSIDTVVEATCRDTCETEFTDGSWAIFTSFDRISKTLQQGPGDAPFSVLNDEFCIDYNEASYSGDIMCYQSNYTGVVTEMITINGVACDSLSADENNCLVGDCSNAGSVQNFTSCDARTVEGRNLENLLGVLNGDDPNLSEPGVCTSSATNNNAGCVLFGLLVASFWMMM